AWGWLTPRRAPLSSRASCVACARVVWLSTVPCSVPTRMLVSTSTLVSVETFSAASLVLTAAVMEASSILSPVVLLGGTDDEQPASATARSRTTEPDCSTSRMPHPPWATSLRRIRAPASSYLPVGVVADPGHRPPRHPCRRKADASGP